MVKTGFQRPSDSNTSVIVDIGDPYPGRAQLLQYYPNLIPNLKTPGLLMWGNNNTGQLGLGNIIYKSSPTQVGSLTNWQSVSEFFQLAAIKTDGTLWSCGYNTFGGLGLGDLNWRSSPVQVGLLTNWQTVSVGNGQGAAAIDTSGRLWTWGYNYYGQLGLGDAYVSTSVRNNRSSPVQVGSLTNWKSVSASANNCVAIKTDGTLWSWGLFNNGKLGLAGNTSPLTTNQSSPVQVGLLANWKSVSSGSGHIASIKTDGTLWTWGYNGYGALGLAGNTSPLTTDQSSPVQVGLLANWQSVSLGSGHTSAIDNVGRLWTWGYNLYGQLGLGNIIYKSSPIQVGSLTNWQSVASGQYHTAAIKTDGTLWAWGSNNDGQLGIGDTTNYSSPIQVGSLTNWKIVASGGATVAIVQGTDF